MTSAASSWIWPGAGSPSPIAMASWGVRFLFRVTLRRHDLAAEFYQIREPRKIPPVMSPDAIGRLLAATQTLKLRVMLALAYGCGLRAGEVVRLRVGDIDSAQAIIRIVQSKKRKDRNVMLPAEVLALLRQWWVMRPKTYDAGVPQTERYLFPSREAAPVSTRQFARLFRHAARAAGIDKPVRVHTLRHSFATHLLERGTDIRLIQALLGHDKLETTAHYTRVATGIIAAVASPIGRLFAKAAQSASAKRRRALRRRHALGRLPAKLLPAHPGAVAAVPPVVPHDARRRSCRGQARLLRYAREARQPACLRGLREAAAPHRMGGLRQSSVCRAEGGAGLSRPLYPPHRDPNRRLIRANAAGVTFTYKDYRVEGAGRFKTMTLATHEFIRRFLMHVLPKGFHRIRHYGLLANGNRAAAIAKARGLLAMAPREDPEAPQPLKPAASPQPLPCCCPRCGGRMVLTLIFAHSWAPDARAPPAAIVRLDTS
jgi:integrase/recombinase XerD